MLIEEKKNLKKLAVLLILFEIVIIFLYSFYVHNDTEVLKNHLVQFYPWFQDVNVMMLIGFGFLMTFLKSYCWGAVGFTFLINSLVTQYYILWHGFWYKVFNQSFMEYGIKIDITSFISASYAVAAVLISFGAIIGRTTPFQLVIILNEALVYYELQAIDVGGSMTIHTFGAFFGLAVSWVLGNKEPIKQKNPSASYKSNMYAMIGTMFLWLFWPSFNAGNMVVIDTKTSSLRLLTVINTIISLMGSCVTSIGMSAYLRGKIDMEDVLNASLAGGVIIGSASSIIQNPVAALVIGSVAGIFSTFGFAKLSPYLKQKGLFDVCGINNLHALPGLIGGLYSGLLFGIYASYPPLNIVNADTGFSYSKQGGIQVGATLLTLGIAVFTGILTGEIMSYTQTIKSNYFFEDEINWIIPLSQNKQLAKSIQINDNNQKQELGDSAKRIMMKQSEVFLIDEYKYN